MDSPERNGDAHIPGLGVMAYQDVHRAVEFVLPDWRAGAGADLERAPLSPVRILDARERPEFISGGPDVQLPRLALELDRSGATSIIAGLDSHVHHGLIVAAATTRDKPDPAQPTSVASRVQTMCHSFHGA